jgi:hypothetical protein
MHLKPTQKCCKLADIVGKIRRGIIVMYLTQSINLPFVFRLLEVFGFDGAKI